MHFCIDEYMLMRICILVFQIQSFQSHEISILAHSVFLCILHTIFRQLLLLLFIEKYIFQIFLFFFTSVRVQINTVCAKRICLIHDEQRIWITHSEKTDNFQIWSWETETEGGGDKKHVQIHCLPFHCINKWKCDFMAFSFFRLFFSSLFSFALYIPSRNKYWIIFLFDIVYCYCCIVDGAFDFIVYLLHLHRQQMDFQ